MEVFLLTLNQMLVMFCFIVAGFVLRKAKLLPESSDKTFSRLCTLFLAPAQNFIVQLTRCTPATFAENGKFVIYGAIIIVLAMLVATLLSYVFVRKKENTNEEKYQRNIYRYALTFGNYGFMGNFLVLGIWGADGLFKYILFCFVISVVCNVWGLYLLIPNNGERSIGKQIVKGLTAPPALALLAGCLGGLLGASEFVPQFLDTAFNNASNCVGPVSMLLAGFVIGGYSFKDMMANGKVYAASLLRLMAIPSVIMLALKALNTDVEIMRCALVCFAPSLGLNTIVFPAAYGGDTKTGAAMAMVSTLLAVITLPIMFYIFLG